MVADLLTQIETKGEEKKEGNGLCIKHERNKISVSRADDFEYEEIIQPTPRKDDRKAFRKLFERERVKNVSDEKTSLGHWRESFTSALSNPVLIARSLIKITTRPLRKGGGEECATRKADRSQH